MAKRLAGKELLDRWEIEGFELLESVCEGLQPYDCDTGQPIPSPQAQTLKNRLDELLDPARPRMTLRKALAECGIPGVEAPDEDLDSLRDRLADLGVSWEGYHPSDSRQERISLISEVVNYCYELEDMKALEENGSDPSETGKVRKLDNTRKMVDERAGIPTISFYRNDDIWKIGEEGKEKDFSHLVGYEYIRFLIENPDHSFKPLEVIHFGKVPDELEFLNQTDFQVIKTNRDLANVIAALEEQLESKCDTDARDEIRHRIDELRKVKNEGLKTFKQKSDSTRINVYKNMKTAATTIQNGLPGLKQYFDIGRSAIIRTGNAFCYQQQNFNMPVKWQLHKSL